MSIEPHAHAQAAPLVGLPPAPVTVATANDPLAGWLQAALDAESLAKGLVRSFFVPAAYKPNPREEGAYETAVANATGAILLGRSLGLDPLTSLQQIYVVHGRPGMYAKLKVALAQAAGHRVWDEVYSPERAVVCGQRKGTDDVVRIEITMQMAKDAGWTSSNDAYRKTPSDMLWARAASRVVDRIAADLLMGVRSIEDIDDDAPGDAQPVSVVASERPRAAAAIAPRVPAQAAPVDEPSTAPDTGVATPPAQGATDPRPISDAQLRKLGVLFGQLGVKGEGERAQRLAIASAVAGRELGSSKDLTLDEARILIDTLEANGPAVVDQVLNAEARALAEEQAAVGQAQAADEAEQAAGGYDAYDPTTDADFGMDGAEAAAEGL